MQDISDSVRLKQKTGWKTQSWHLPTKGCQSSWPGLLSPSPVRAPSCNPEPEGAMKRCSSEQHFNHSDASLFAADRLLGISCKSPDSTFAFHSKQCSQESLEAQDEAVVYTVGAAARCARAEAAVSAPGPSGVSSCPDPGQGQASLGHGMPAVPHVLTPQDLQPPQPLRPPQQQTHPPAPDIGPCPNQSLLLPNSIVQAQAEEAQPVQAACSSSPGPNAPSCSKPSAMPSSHPSFNRPGPMHQVTSSSASTPSHRQHSGLSSGRRRFNSGDDSSGALTPAGSSANDLPSTLSHNPHSQSSPHVACTSSSRPLSLSKNPSSTSLVSRAVPTPVPAYSRLGAGIPAPHAAIPLSDSSGRAPLLGSSSGQLSASSSSDECEEATRRITAAYPGLLHSSHERHKSWSILGGKGLDSVTPRRLQSQEDLLRSASHALDEVHALERRRQSRSNYHLTSGQAAVELFMRLNHARQTLDFATRQAATFSSLDRAQLDVWEALDMLDELREYEAALLSASSQVDPDMSLKEHAFQTAELCRLAHPDKDWLHLVGLLHGLGKLLAHQRFGSQPQWATCGETFPLGCRFDPSLRGAQFFSANPDRRRRLFNSPLGIYQPGCGLHNVFMSWSASEYLYLMLLLNDTSLPPEALFLIRHQKFYSLTESCCAYRHLLNKQDETLLPLLASFQKLSLYRRVPIPPESALSPEQQQAYYGGLIQKYIGGAKLAW